MLYKSSSTFLLILLLTNHIESARILAVFPAPSISHQVVFRPLTQALAKRGHEVVIITPDPVFTNGKGPANLTEIDVHDISYKIWHDNFVSQIPELSPYGLIKRGLQIMIDVAIEQLETPQIQEFLQKEQEFDLVIVEAFVDLALGFGHKYNAPIIQMSSFHGTSINYETMGAPNHMFLYPDVIRQKLSNLTVLDKMYEVLVESLLNFIYKVNYVPELNKALKKYFGPDTPELHELQSKVDMLFVNTFPVWEGNRPVPPGIINLGGLHLRPSKELPKDLKSYLDSSDKGIVYVSFGTNVNPSQLSEEKIRIFLRVFSKLPYDVMWKWDKDELPGKPDNVRIFKWVPQNDLLRHPKVKLFITQGGMQSTDEAIVAGVPLIGIPILIDQFYNVEKYLIHKIGLKLTMDNLTEKDLHNAITTVIEDESYRNNVIRLNTLMRDQPQRPLDRAVWWTEHVLRHGGARHLRAPAAGIGWAEYLELKLIAALFVTITIILAINVLFMYFFVKLLMRLFKKKKAKMY